MGRASYEMPTMAEEDVGAMLAEALGMGEGEGKRAIHAIHGFNLAMLTVLARSEEPNGFMVVNFSDGTAMVAMPPGPDARLKIAQWALAQLVIGDGAHAAEEETG